ncbi:hypothetical protein [Vibrio fortis]|uniref:hypothetical protein n=1 Tax=Vibrio fortis TaxID=212667 RepID=UPI0038CD5F4F
MKNKSRKEAEKPPMSFDAKAMFGCQLIMFLTMFIKPFETVLHYVYLAAFLLAAFMLVSIFQKLKSGWSWPGLSLKNIVSAAFNIAATYAFFSFVAYSMSDTTLAARLSLENWEALLHETSQVILQTALSDSNTVVWFLIGAAIFWGNLMRDFNFLVMTQYEFEQQCQRKRTDTIVFK